MRYEANAVIVGIAWFRCVVPNEVGKILLLQCASDQVKFGAKTA